jgi:hypothetical protein
VIQRTRMFGVLASSPPMRCCSAIHSITGPSHTAKVFPVPVGACTSPFSPWR